MRRRLGYFEVRAKWIGVVEIPPDAPSPDLGKWNARFGAALVGVTSGWVTNLNVLLSSISLEAARPIARAVSGRYGGIIGVQTMALQVRRVWTANRALLRVLFCSIRMESKLLATCRTQLIWERS